MFLLKWFRCLCLLPVVFSRSSSWVVPTFDTLEETAVPQTPFELDDVLSGQYWAQTWNGTWISGKIT